MHRDRVGPRATEVWPWDGARRSSGRDGAARPDDDARGLPRRGGALRDGVPVPRWRGEVRLHRPTAGRADQGGEGRRLDAATARARDAARAGGMAVGTWAREHGFGLSPDAPEVLDFYADRSPIFLATSFDPTRAAQRGQRLGDGTPVHLTIPTTNAWVPLRILGLGLQPRDQIQADVYLLTDRRPALAPVPDQAVRLEQSRAASPELLTDLRLDRGMRWLPGSGMWLSYLKVDTTAGALRHDLAVDSSGQGTPSLLAAGLLDPQSGTPLVGAASQGSSPFQRLLWPAAALLAGLALALLVVTRMTRTARR